MDAARPLYRWHLDQRLGWASLSPSEEELRVQAKGHHLDYEVTVLGLALWSAARERACRLGDVALLDAAAVCRRLARENRLPAILPDIRPGKGGGRLPPQDDLVPVATAVEQLLISHAEEPLVPGTPLGPDRLSYRLLELRAYPGSTGPGHAGWVSGIRYAQESLDRARQKLRSGIWTITEADRAAVRATGLCGFSAPVYDYPATPKASPRGPSWLQRACWLIHLDAQLRAAAESAPRQADGTRSHMDLLLSAQGMLFDDLESAVTELDALWSQEAVLDSAAWEQQHVPALLKQQTAAVEASIDELAAFLRHLLDDARP
ncbi:hypothetical protein ACIBO6_02160 [Streptomyces luteogriseus]|uniref:hypothetical protein n=1 Tax=Streptomyces luteogriseus TaxID=68233 RepID=UPI0037895B46